MTASVGGVRSITSLTSHPGWVQTHDFVGCMRAVTVENQDMFSVKAASNLTRHCEMTTYSACESSSPCQNGGQCITEYNSYRCKCSENYIGINCEKGLSRKITSVLVTTHRFFLERDFYLVSIQPALCQPVYYFTCIYYSFSNTE